MLHTNDYREILRDEFNRRSSAIKHKRYTLKSFASELGILPSSLSDILNYKRGMSETTARKVCRELELEEEGVELFCQLVKMADSASRRTRIRAQEEIDRMRKEMDERVLLDSETIKALSDWYYYAILILVDVKDFEGDTSWIAERLEISEELAVNAVERLKLLGLIEENEGKLRRTQKSFRTPSQGEMNRPLRQVHRQLFDKAAEALEKQELERRGFRFSMMSVHPSHIPMIKAKTAEFMKEITDKVDNDDVEKSRVYAFSTQLFELGKSE